MVNNINDDDAREEEVTVDETDKEEADKEEEEEEGDDEEQRGTIDITDFEDLKTYKDIPNFNKFPPWLQKMVKEFKCISAINHGCRTCKIHIAQKCQNPKQQPDSSPTPSQPERVSRSTSGQTGERRIDQEGTKGMSIQVKSFLQTKKKQ